MLKWAVGQRIPSSASSTCSDITPGIACCSSTFRQNTFKLQSTRSTSVRTAYVRNLKTADKENRRRCRRSLEKEMVKSASGSTRNRDSIYMQLDNVPAALRDVSNHWSPNCENFSEREARSVKRRHVRLKKSPCKVASHKYTNEQPLQSLGNLSEKNNICIRPDEDNNVTSRELLKEPLEKRKQPCNGQHAAPSQNPSTQPVDLNKTSMLVDNPLYFTIQTSPPEEPDELYHKGLPVKQFKNPVSKSCDNLSRLPCSNDNPICDIADGNPCEVSSLTRNLSWLRLNGRNGADLSTLQLFNISNGGIDDFDGSALSSLDITNPNSAVLSDTNLSNFSPTTASSRLSLKRKISLSADDLHQLTGDLSRVPDTIEKIKSKRRCVVFNEQSFPLNTPPLSDCSHHSSGVTSIDLDKPSTLKRQRVIRRRKRSAITVPQTIYNKNLKSWLTLPNGIPSPFEVTDTHFKKLSCTPMLSSTIGHDVTSATLRCDDEPSEFNIMKKAMSTPKANHPLNLTEDVFLSPGIRPLLDSVMQTSSEPANSKPKLQDETNFYASPASEQTWNSHGKHLAKPSIDLDDDEDDVVDNVIGSSSILDSTQTSNSSRINDDQDVFSSIVSSTPTLASTPTTAAERQSRSRRCLSFVSPTTPKTTAKYAKNECGQLDLRIYYNNGLLTVHIIRARNLQKNLGELPCNAYVKVNLVPQGSCKTFHRTCVRKNSFNPKFDHKFSMEISECDLNKRVLISTWHRDRGKQKSEFLGCMSFAIKNILKKEVNGSYKLLPQNSNKSFPTQPQQSHDLMEAQTTYMVESKSNSSEKKKLNAPSIGNEKLRSMTVTRKEMNKVHEEYLFLQHLELDPVLPGKDQDVKKSGRTPFTTTHKLTRQNSGSYGFSIAWTHPPRVERVEPNLPADSAGLLPGDNVIFVNKANVVTLSEEKILDIIKSCGNQLVLEIYRKPLANGTLSNNMQRVSHQLPSKQSSRSHLRDSNPNYESGSTTAYSTATAASTEASKKRLLLPQITFSSEEKVEELENSRQNFVYQLLKKEQQYALCLQFGISRFFLPLAERRDVIRPNEHAVLFQNVQELLRITEDLLERTMLEEGESFGKSVAKIYWKKFPAISSAYRRYCCGLKKADCILVEKTRCGEFMRLVTDPPVPKKRPDLISFIHKPLQHFRDVLKILQLISNCKESKELDHHVLLKLISDLQATYRDITVESGLMDCGAEGRPILSLQDLESRLVFTRCKPFTLNTQGRKWIFGGDLSRVEGKSTRVFWALLFSDILLFTKINRDRVVFVTEEPLSLATVAETQFSIKKKDTEFRLILGINGRNNCNTTSSGNHSPAQQGCVPMVHFHSPLAKRTPHNKDIRRRTLVFRAPSPELKAVWQNLIQRQVIKINTTGQGNSPATSPTDSPNLYINDSSVTTETTSTVYKLQCDGSVDDIIERKCKILGKSSTGKGRAFHLAQWMRGELDQEKNSQTWSEPEIETWSEEMLRQRAHEQNTHHDINGSRITQVRVFDINDNPLNFQPISGTDQLGPKEIFCGTVPLCQKCHETCLQLSSRSCSASHRRESDSSADAFLDCNNKWTDLIVPTILSPVEPFNPLSEGVIPSSKFATVADFQDIQNANAIDTERSDEENGGEIDEDDDDANSIQDLPYKNLNNQSSNLKRYESITNLNVIVDQSLEDTSDASAPTTISPDCETSVTINGGLAMSWANRASYFVAQKVALFEKIGENVQDTLRYLRPSRDLELTSTSQTLAFEEDCENSGGTSGDEFWGTPNSGGASVASNECAPSPISSYDDDDGEDEDKIIEEMLLNRTTAMLAQQQHNMTPSRMIQNKARLEPLPEAEEENITKSSTSSISSEDTSATASDCTMSCPVPQSSSLMSAGNNSYNSYIGQSSTIFGKIKLRRSQSVDESTGEIEKPTSSPDISKSIRKSKKSILLRFFSRDIHQTLEDKQDEKLWRKLRRRQTN